MHCLPWNVFVFICPGSVGSGSQSSSKYNPSLFHACLHVWLNVIVSRGSIVLNVVVLFLSVCECVCVHMCLGFHAPVLCFSTHAAWVLMSCCLISNEMLFIPQLELLWAINHANKNHLKICVVDFINICGCRSVPQIKHKVFFFVMFQAEWMLFLCG